MAGTLFVVATPIGNLEDITLRALRTLREVDLIAAEDTRRTAKLLAHYEIHRPMVSLHAHNEFREAPKLIARIMAGLSVALVTDAGTPGISDPGELLIRLAREKGVPVTPIPGPSSITAAISVSGYPAGHFIFKGFPPRSGQARTAWLHEVAETSALVVAFESPHRITKTMDDLRNLLGNRQIQIHRELTKFNEEYVISPSIGPDGPITTLGEFVIVIQPASCHPRNVRSDPELADIAAAMVGCMTINNAFDEESAVELAAKATGVSVQAARKAWKKHKIAQKRRTDQLS